MEIAAVESATSSTARGRVPSAAPAPNGFDAALATARRTETPAKSATYQVKSGDTLSGIVLAHLRAQGKAPGAAELYDTVQQIAKANGLSNPDLIFPGQELSLEAPGGAAEASGDVAREELMRALLPPPEFAAAASDVGGPKLPVRNFSHVRLEAIREMAMEISDAITHPIRYAKGSESLMRLLPSPILRNEREAVAALRDKKAAEEADSAPATVESPWRKILTVPARLTSEFGPRRDPFDGTKTRHDGIDLATARGTKVYPMEAGVVKFSGWMPGYGNVVVVKHEGGIETVYGHNAKNLVKSGQSVGAEDAIATVGSSGRSTGPHLHFEIREKGKAVDPVPQLTEFAEQS